MSKLCTKYIATTLNYLDSSVVRVVKVDHFDFSSAKFKYYTQYLIIRNGLIRNSAEFLGNLRNEHRAGQI